MVRKLLANRLVRFGAVGCIVTVFFMGVNALLGRAFGLSPGLAFLVAYPPALCLHFTLNKLWTFGDSRATSSRHLAEYLNSVLITFLIQWPAFAVLHDGLHYRGWLAAGGANVLQMAASFGLLKWRVFRQNPTTEAGSARDSWHRLVILLVVLSTSALLAWTVLGKWALPDFNKSEGDYYNRLVTGFQKGTLALDIAVPDALRTAANPWDPATRPKVPYLHDASFYGGKYYLYFGVVPAVILFWPFRILTGLALPFSLATLVFLVGANAFSSLLWIRILKERYPRAGLMTKLIGVLAIGLCGGQLALARRPSIWEMPISGGYFFVTLMIVFAYMALTAARPRTWLVLTGLCLGLAVGCRPTLVACGGGLAFLVLVVGWREGGPLAGRVARTMKAALWAGIPLAVIMAALFGYNYARFGSPFEFGIKYQLNTTYEVDAHHFRISFIPFNFHAYFLSMPRMARYFPFLHQPDLGNVPTGYYGTEYVYGIFLVCPLILGAALLLMPWVWRSKAPLPVFAAYLVSLALPITAMLLCFDTAASRYTVDFIPLWMWAAMIGWASLEEHACATGPSRTVRVWGARLAFGACTVVSLLTTVTLSLALHGVLVFNEPQTYFRIAKVFNLPVALYERLKGERYGKLEMDVRFPERPSGSLEPLVVTGVSYECDYFFVFYGSDKYVQLGFENSGDGMLLSKPIHYDPAKVYRLGFSSGSILPPEGHPIYGDWTEYQLHSLLNWVRIDVNGKPVIHQERQSHEGAPEFLQIGEDVHGAAFGRKFTGTISNVHREALEKDFKSPETHGDVVLDVNLPAEVVDGPQPLLVVGKTGNAELVGYRTLDANHFSIAYEYWGGGEWESPPIEVPAERSVRLRIRLGSLLVPAANNPYYSLLKDDVVVWVNDRAVYWRKAAGQLGDKRVELLANLIGSSAMRRSFQGVLWDEHREPPPSWKPGPFKKLDLYLGGRGERCQPLVATGETGRADTLAILWLPGGKARLLYDHWGSSVASSADFAWNALDMHHLEIQAPSFQTLDKAVQGEDTGRLIVTLDGTDIMNQNVRYFDANSASAVYGKNPAGSSVTENSIDLFLGDISQDD